MTSFDHFERSLPALFDELAAPRVPDYFDDLLTRTAATRQWPEWVFPERWSFMSVISRRFAAVPRIPWRMGALVALLAVAALVAAIVAGAVLNPRPAPYGPAVNGDIVMSDAQNRIVIGDATAGTSRVLVGDGENWGPTFSLDGSRIAFFRKAPSGWDVNVIRADGSGLIKLTPTPVIDAAYMGWSPHGDRILLVDPAGRMLLYDTTRNAEPIDLTAPFKLGHAEVGLGYNFRSDAAFRPPDGREILFLASLGPKLMAMSSDGTTVRTLVDTMTTGASVLSVKGAHWSPGGETVLFLAQAQGSQRWHAWLVDADGSNLRPLSALTTDPNSDQNSALWSPDGTQVAFQYWTAHENDDGQDFHPIGVVDVAAGPNGPVRDVGPTIDNGYVSWDWSPDGKSILEVPQDGSREILIVDSTTGLWTTAPWQVEDPISWQRVAK
jgi:hypothetical protein